METTEVKNCKKINDKKTNLILGISSGFTILISILEILDTPSEVLFPIAMFFGVIFIVIALLLFGKRER